MKNKLLEYRAMILWYLLTLIILFLFFQNTRSDSYQLFNTVRLQYAEKGAYTPPLNLPAGNYTLTINYNIPSAGQVPFTIHTTEDTLINVNLPASEAYYRTTFTTDIGTDHFYLEFPEQNEESFSLYNYELESSGLFYTDHIYFMILFLMFSGICCFFMLHPYGKRLTDQQKMAGLILIGLIIFTSYPFFTDYLMFGHDLRGHLVRIEGVKDALQSGQFPAAIYPVTNNGYGLMGFLYPNIFLYIPALLRLGGVSMVVSYQTMGILINAATAFICYFSIKSITKNYYAPLIATVFYMLSPYRLTDLFIRASIGEVTAMIFLPAALAGLYHIFLGDKKKWYLLVIGYTGILQSHVLSCLLIAFFSIIFGVIFIIKLMNEKRILSLLKAMIMTLLCNLWYLVPFLSIYKQKLGMVTISNGDFYLDAIFPAQLFQTKTNIAYSLNLADGMGGEMPLSLGFIGFIAIGLICFYIFDRIKSSHYSFVTACFVLALFLLFAATTLFPWIYLTDFETIGNLLGMLQFPSRFLLLVTVILAVILPLAITNSPLLNLYRKAIFIVILITGLYAGTELMDTYQNQDIYITKLDGGLTDVDLPEYWPKDTDKSIFEDKKPLFTESVTGANYEKNGSRITFTYSASEEGYAELPLLFYTGYHAVTNKGETLSLLNGTGNKIRVLLPASEKSTVTVYYHWRTLYYGCLVISVISFIILFFIFFGKNLKKLLLSSKSI